MRRAPIVLGATATGLAAVLAFHTTTAPLSLSSLNGDTRTSPTDNGSSTTTTPPETNSTTTSSTGTSPTSTSSSPTPTTTHAASTPTTTTVPTSTRSAIGASENYHYGILSVKVTVRGDKIADVAIAALDDGGNFRSQSIDEQSIPILEQEALAAQSANIQGVSGASYTSAGFQASLQNALLSLKL